jgi:hypothetical protein
MTLQERTNAMKPLATFAAGTMLMIGTSMAWGADTKPKTTPAHSPESIECSKRADAKGMHGEERKKFRAACKKELKGNAKATTTPAPAPAPKTETPASPK